MKKYIIICYLKYGGKTMKVKVKMYNGTPTAFINEKPVFYSAMWGVPPKAEGYEEAEIARCYAKAGVHIYAFDVGTKYEWREPHSDGSPHFDFSSLQKKLTRIVEADPEALFHFRMHYEMPDWWRDRFPGESEIDSDGNLCKQSFASSFWRSRAKEFIHAYAEKLTQIGFIDKTAAFQVGAGGSLEWVKGDTSMGRRCGDYSAPMKAYFRNWLRKRYGTEAALRKAWGNDSVTFETVMVPPAEEQLNTRRYCFRDPVKEGNVIDYYRALAGLCADLVIDYCKTVKEAGKGQILAGAFYGYLAELAWNQCFFGVSDESEVSTIQRCGHLGLKRVLQSDAVDFLVSPCSYGFRGIGGAGAPMPPTESLRKNGKLYIFEEDSRTLTAGRDHNYGRTYTNRDSEAVLKRNFSDVLIRSMGIWWLSHHQNPIEEPSFQELITRFKRIGEFSLSLPRHPQAEIAVLLDDESFYFESLRNDLDLSLIFQQRLWGLSRIGAPYDFYLLDDFLNGDTAQYKLVVFLNAFSLDVSRRKAIDAKVKRDGKTLLWLYAPGIIKEEEESIENMTELTGFSFGWAEHPWYVKCHVTRFDHPITKDLPQDLFWGTDSKLCPIYHIEDGDAAVLGQVVYSLGRCKPGLGIKDFGGWRSVYSAAPNVPPRLLQGVAKHAGVHIYNNEPEVFYANDHFLCIHTLKGGKRLIKLPYKTEIVYELFTKKLIAENTDEFTLSLDPVSTVLFYTGSSKKLKDWFY
jgi:hypothetical protein